MEEAAQKWCHIPDQYLCEITWSKNQQQRLTVLGIHRANRHEKLKKMKVLLMETTTQTRVDHMSPAVHLISHPKQKWHVSFHACFGKWGACILTVFMEITHTHTGSEAQLPAGKCWHPWGPRPVPRAHTRLTHSASWPQRNKGDFMSLFKSCGFGYIWAAPYMDLLRTDLSSITEAQAQIWPWACSEQHSVLLMWETGTGGLNKRHGKITAPALDRVQACDKHRLKYTLWPISDQIFRVIWSTRVQISCVLTNAGPASRCVQKH